jgi:hypothetical protein
MSLNIGMLEFMAIQSNLVSAASQPLTHTTDVRDRSFVYSSLITAPDFNTVIPVLEHVRPGTTVILDVDNTLYYAGDDEFCMKYSFEYDPREGSQYKRFVNGYLIPKYGEEKARKLLFKAHCSTHPTLINSLWPVLVKHLANKGVTVIRLTAISGDQKIGNATLADLRLRTEKSLGLDFASLFSYSKDPVFSSRVTSNGVPVTVMAKEGEIFCCQWPKDEVLLEYWSQVGFPEEAVVVDDQRVNVLKILKMCTTKNVSCTGVYYTELAVESPGKFDEELAVLKFDILDKEGVWVSDSEAKKRPPIRFVGPIYSIALSEEEIELEDFRAKESVPLQEEGQVPYSCCTLL